MYAVRDAQDSSLVSDEESRGAAIERRLGELGVGFREFEAKTGINRKTLGRAIHNDPTVRENTYKLIEDWIDTTEAANRGLMDQGVGADIVEFRLSGNFGVDVVVKGPIRDKLALEESVARLLREMRGPGH